MINQTPSVCIENEQRDPVAWILQQDYGCIGMLHVIPEYRRAKLGSAVTILLPCYHASDGEITKGRRLYIFFR